MFFANGKRACLKEVSLQAGRQAFMNNYRLLYLTNFLREDVGIEVAIANAVKSLDGSRFDIWLGGLFEGGQLYRRLPLPASRVLCFGLPIDRVLCFGCWSNIPALLLGVQRVARFIRRHNIQIVHTHHYHAGVIGRIAARVGGAPISLVTEHSTQYPRKDHDFLIERALARITTQYIAVSAAVKDAVAKQIHISRERFEVIPNSLPLHEIPDLSTDARQRKREQLQLAPNQPVIISIGRMQPEKGFPILLHAARRLVQQFPEAIFLIVGVGPLESQLRQMVLELDLADNIRFLGVRHDVYELLQISEVLALPSLVEGLPLVLMEAGACQIPVVATNIGGIAEMIADGVNGFLIPVNDSTALAERLAELLRNPSLRTSMGVSGRQVVTERYRSDLVGAQLAELYRQLLLAKHISSHTS
jgi:glycosyltransferase involved in cell wall biosynthesis